jgi:hypothetical protein
MNNKPYKLLDEQKRSRLLDAIRLGSFIEHACAYAGITSRTYRKWRELAEDDVQPYAKLFEEIRYAESESILRRLGRIEKAGIDGTWTADAWLLERKYPDQFGKKDKVEVSGEINKPKIIDLTWADGSIIDRDDIKEVKEEEE